MAIDLGSGNSTRYYRVDDHDDLSLPNGDWSWITLCYWPSGQIAANAYYIVSTGTVQTANSFNLFIGSDPNWPAVIVNTGATLQVPGTAPKDKWMVFYSARRSNNVYVGQCALGVSSATESAGQSLTAGSNGTGLYIGSRNDLNVNRFWSGRIGHVSFVPGYGVTQDDVVALANGAPLLSMPFAPNIKFLLHGRKADTTISDLIGSKVATRFGSSYGANEEDVQTPYIWVPSYLRGVPPTSGVTGTVAYTNINDTSSATGATTITGSSATTNADDTSAATGATTVTGSSATTNADDTSEATGAVGAEVIGSVAYTNIDDVSEASASVGSEIVGTVAYTNIDDVSEAAGTTAVIGTGASTNENDTSSASSTTTVIGTSATTNTDDVSEAAGTVETEAVTGTVEVTNADDVSAASATTTVIGSSVTTNTNDQSASFAIINNGTIVEAALTSVTATTLRIKKPGIPVGTPDWLKTMMEIVTGRRGNKIDIPQFQTLTFSATPTKAELEALYAYTNNVRDALDQLINRFDS